MPKSWDGMAATSDLAFILMLHAVEAKGSLPSRRELFDQHVYRLYGITPAERHAFSKAGWRGCRFEIGRRQLLPEYPLLAVSARLSRKRHRLAPAIPLSVP